MNTFELYIEGNSCAMIWRGDSRPDIVRLGDGRAFRFYRFAKPKGPGDWACIYKPATVAEFAAA